MKCSFAEPKIDNLLAKISQTYLLSQGKLMQPYF
jgi:hypothetical protein